MSSILPIDPDIEAQPADENLAIQRIKRVIESILRLENPIAQKGEEQPTVQRDAHPKAHGIVEATFEIDERLPRECRWGLFARKYERTYKAWVRFSNGEKHDDRDKDARGMAIKLRDVRGEQLLDDANDTQDFVLMDFPHFFIQNAAQYVRFVKRLHAGVKFLFFLRHPLLALKARKLPRHAHNPLAQTYFSQVPYKLGPHAVKYAARPRRPAPERAEPGENHLREAMQKTLDDREVVYDFLVQFQTDSKRMSVEDSTSVWDEAASPWTKVATLRIHSQTFTTDERDELAENLSFNPWHTLRDHAPLGSLNRIRRAVYVHIADLRRELNGVKAPLARGDDAVSDGDTRDTESGSSESD